MPLGPFDPIPPREKIRRSHVNDLRTALTGIQDAYDVAVANGFVGTRGQWLDSLKGGAPGPPGPPGPPGDLDEAVGPGTDGKVLGWVGSSPGVPDWVDPPSGGDVRPGMVVRADDYASVQDAVDAISTAGDGGTVLFSAGRDSVYTISDTVTYPSGVSFMGEGRGGGGGIAYQWPVINWTGAEGGTMFAQVNESGISTSHTGNFFRGLTFRGWHWSTGNALTDPVATTAIHHYDNNDYGCSIEYCQFEYFRGSPVRYENGGINLFFQHLRFDRYGQDGSPALYFGSSGLSNYHFRDIACDNERIGAGGASNASANGGLLTVDLSGDTTGNAHVNFSIENIKMEQNSPYPSGTGAITLIPRDNGTGDQFQFRIANVRNLPYNANASDPDGSLNLSNIDGFVYAATGRQGYAQGVIVNSKLKLRGFGAMPDGLRRVGVNNYIPFMVITPITQRTGTKTFMTTDMEAVTEMNDLNVIGGLFVAGKPATPPMVAATSGWTSPYTVEVGQEFMTDTLTSGSTSMTKAVCVVEGTLGPAIAATATTTIGNIEVTVSDTSEFAAGQWITFGGEGAAEKWKIAAVDPPVSKIYLASAAGLGAGTGRTISFAAPMFKTYTVTLA